MHKIGIDLGGTKCEGVILNQANKEVYRERVPTHQENGYQAILMTVQTLYNKLVQQLRGASHTIGIGTPGSISPKSGLMRNSNTLALNDKDLLNDLNDLIKHDLIVENDANCFTLAEALLGEFKSDKLTFGVILGTGCGGGFVRDKRLMTGLTGNSGEWGHSSIDPDGPDCYCGKKGCVETYISGGGAQNRYFEMTGHQATMEEIIQGYRDQKPPATEFMKQYFNWFGRALSNVVNIIDPDIIIIGGGLSNMREIYNEGQTAFEQCIFSDYYPNKIQKNSLGDSAGVLGAAMLHTYKSKGSSL
ncbi:MAG: fructokinase [Candidatus Omnitrophota bacterium]|jgi:fructokinase